MIKMAPPLSTRLCSINKIMCCCLLLQWLLLVLLQAQPISAKQHLRRSYPRLGVPKKGLKLGYRLRDADQSTDHFKTFNYSQTLDHFNYRPESYTTFQQRYVINSRYWGGPNTTSPIFVYTGGESGLDEDVDTSGFMTDNAQRFKALLVYLEHRYYGQSFPFGSKEKAYKNASTLGYFTSEQALADYAELITYLKKKFSAEDCPVIVLGASYGGMLAAWFRLKYPHIAMGALAISAPILYFDGVTPSDAYYSIVTKDFRDTSESCYNTIRESWYEIYRISSTFADLEVLRKKFKSCGPLHLSDLPDYLEYMYCSAAQYDSPVDSSVAKICKAIDGAPEGSRVVDRIFAGLVAAQGEQDCYDIAPSASDDSTTDSESTTLDGWSWQTCSDMVLAIAAGSNETTMFRQAPFDLDGFMEWCHELYGVYPRPHWATTEYGGYNIKRVLEKFASNIIFSNGLKDPFSGGGVLQNISDSVVAVYTTQGSHCLDLMAARADDPEWLTKQRDTEVRIIEGWIAEYQAKLHAAGQKTKA